MSSENKCMTQEISKFNAVLQMIPVFQTINSYLQYTQCQYLYNKCMTQESSKVKVLQMIPVF